MRDSISDREIVQGLVENNSRVINYLYSEVGPKVKHIIMRSGGSKEEANDIFQEGIITAFENIRSEKYSLRDNTKFTTYLIQVCKYKWYDISNSARKSKNINLDTDFQDDEDIVKDIIRQEQYKKLHKLIDDLGERCKEILNRFYWEKESMTEIGEALNMLPKSVKNGKYRCMKELRDLAHKLQ